MLKSDATDEATVEYALTHEFCCQCCGMCKCHGCVINALAAKLKAHQDWIYCAYCGHREKAEDGQLVKIAEHIGVCEKHPIRQMQLEIDRLHHLLRHKHDQIVWLEAKLKRREPMGGL